MPRWFQIREIFETEIWDVYYFKYNILSLLVYKHRYTQLIERKGFVISSSRSINYVDIVKVITKSCLELN